MKNILFVGKNTIILCKKQDIRVNFHIFAHDWN